jgi:hypothetical protein
LNKEELHKFIKVLQEVYEQLEDITPREKMIRQFENATGMWIDRNLDL